VPCHKASMGEGSVRVGKASCIICVVTRCLLQFCQNVSNDAHVTAESVFYRKNHSGNGNMVADYVYLQNADQVCIGPMLCDICNIYVPVT
jgi:hypothetical protein